jgi:hypothetical protein
LKFGDFGAFFSKKRKKPLYELYWIFSFLSPTGQKLPVKKKL